MSIRDQGGDWNAFFGGIAQTLIPSAIGFQKMRGNEYALTELSREQKLQDELLQIEYPEMVDPATGTAGWDPEALDQANVKRFQTILKYKGPDAAMEDRQKYLQKMHQQYVMDLQQGVIAYQGKDIDSAADALTRASKWVNKSGNKGKYVAMNGQLVFQEYDKDNNLVDEEPLTQENLYSLLGVAQNPDLFFRLQDNDKTRATTERGQDFTRETNMDRNAIDLATAKRGAGSTGKNSEDELLKNVYDNIEKLALESAGVDAETGTAATPELAREIARAQGIARATHNIEPHGTQEYVNVAKILEQAAINPEVAKIIEQEGWDLREIEDQGVVYIRIPGVGRFLMPSDTVPPNFRRVMQQPGAGEEG